MKKHEVILGTMPKDDDKKDAIHIAVIPMVARERLFPGQHVSLVDGKISKEHSTLVGIVDPFLRAPIEVGTTFWLLLYPQTITSLRHDWTHPAFPEEVQPSLESFCAKHGIPIDALLSAARHSDGDVICLGEDLPSALYDEDIQKECLELLSKTLKKEFQKQAYFRCAC